VDSATFFLYSGDSLFSSGFGAFPVALTVVMVCLDRGEDVLGGATRPALALRVVRPFWSSPSADEGASKARMRDCDGDRVGKLMTCSRKCVE
jgi:hypothetical protein